MPAVRVPGRKPLLHDLYYCLKSSFSGSVIARYGSEGSEYLSMDLELLQGNGGGHESPLTEAARRAIRLLFRRAGGFR